VIYLDALVCLLMVVVAVTATLVRNLVSAVILVGVVSLLVSYLFLRMGAPDVAMTEAAIGAALTTVIFLIALRRTGERR
jgi:energy-converting hydrogenase B subunit D